MGSVLWFEIDDIVLGLRIVDFSIKYFDLENYQKIEYKNIIIRKPKIHGAGLDISSLHWSNPREISDLLFSKMLNQ